MPKTLTARKPLSILVLAAAALAAGCKSPSKIEDRMTRELPAPGAPAAPAPAPVAAPATDDTRPAASAEPANKLSESYTLKVTGMTCRFVCVREVVAALKSVPGVTNVIIDYDAYKAIVHCEVGTNPDDLLAALQATGKYSGLVLPK